MVAVEYDGDQHRSDRRQYVKDLSRLRMFEHRGWDRGSGGRRRLAVRRHRSRHVNQRDDTPGEATAAYASRWSDRTADA